MKLKQYQADTLSVLRRFFEEARIGGPQNAYASVTNEPEQAARLGRYRGNYTSLETLPDVPYICLRLPTGGGKTILGTHAIAVARDTWIEKDFPLVLWLVLSNTIRLQTVEALKNIRHPYRQTLDEAFSGRVRVFDIADFTHIRPHDLRDHCCVVVGTIQTLRVSNTEGRKVYAHHEEMEPHFSTVPGTAPGLEMLESGGVKFSFANLLHVHRPLMIVDEAHNAVTGLTREMQARVNPCAIIELTATPRDNQGRLLSNILHSVTAQELKNEEMIKLPIILSEHTSWEGAVNGAIVARASLAEKARDDPGHIRPLVLFQAQNKDQDVTVEVLKTYLVDIERIPEHAIAVATGDQRELDGVDLFDPQCGIQYIITVEALKEGWDCSFAYVFCSVACIRSAVNVEQLLGRVLRMPYAGRRRSEDLNKAYAFLSEPESGAAALALVDNLVAMGFEEEEARENVEQVPLGFDDRDNQGGLFDQSDAKTPALIYTIETTPEVVSDLRKTKYDGVTIRDCGDGKVELSLSGFVSDTSEQSLRDVLPESERPGFTDVVEKHRNKIKNRLPPAERGEVFNVPRLMVGVQGVMEYADADVLMESHDWSLLNHAPKMDEREFDVHETARSFEIDIDGRRVRYQFASETEQLALNVEGEGWTPEALVLWLDWKVRRMDLHQHELLRWLREIVDHLINVRGIHLSALMRCKFLLSRAIGEKIDGIRSRERRSVYQCHLFGPDARVEVSFNNAFVFRDGMYQGRRHYVGRWKPGRHFLGPDQVPAFDGADDGEEMQCARILDSLPGVTYWIRNVSCDRDSFWLPTATDKFYPDFVARLEDGRLCVVEYKGAHIAQGADTHEKRTIGALWERKSGGTGLFIMAEQSINGKDVRQQLMEKIGAA